MNKHISLLLPNKPGQFYEAISILSRSNVNILGYGLTSEGRAGMLHLLCDPYQIAYQVLLEKYSFYCTEKEVLIIELEHKPGTLKSILEVLAHAAINLPNSYLGFSTQGMALIVLEFDNQKDLCKAKELLKAENVKLQ